ncbi:MAG: hypothetical protein WCW87_00215 [Candidatus Paceibacterota bacterium]
MKKHPIKVEGFDGTLEELAQKVGRMRYDKVAEFFGHLEREIERQSEGDLKRGRVQLSELLKKGAMKLIDLKKHFEKIMKLCEPYMKDELFH